MELEAVLWELAEHQHGVVGRRQLLVRGFTDNALRALERRRALEHLSAEVMRLRGSAPTDLTRAMAAVLDSPPGAALSHGSAAALWRVPGFELRGDMHVTIPRQGARMRTRLAVVHFHKDMPMTETVIHRGIPVTSPTMVTFHLAGTEHPARAARTHDHLLSRHLTSGTRLRELTDLIGGSGRNGTRLARELSADADDQPPPESGFERRVEWLAGKAGLQVRRQVPLGDSEFIGRVDFDIVGRPGVLEAQSLTYHSSPMSAESDRDRIARLVAMGLSVMTIWDYQAFHHRDHAIDQIARFAQLIGTRPPFHFECPDP